MDLEELKQSIISKGINYDDLLKEEDRFIKEGSLFQWLGSKGTSFECYLQFVNTTYTSNITVLNNKIDQYRVVFYALLKPFQSQFFYWTLLLLIMYKFNFKKPIIKLVLYHYVLR